MSRQPRHRQYCEKFVKDNIRVLHQTCDGTKKAGHISGNELNVFCNNNAFDGEKCYRVCANILPRVKRKCLDGSLERSSSTTSPSDGEELLSPSKRIGQKETWLQSVLKKAERYRKQYSELVLRERQRRVSDLTYEVLATCVNRKSLKEEGYI